MIIGVDVGMKGGVVCLDSDGTWIAGVRMPLTTLGSRQVVDTDVLNNFVNDAMNLNMITWPVAIAIAGQGTPRPDQVGLRALGGPPLEGGCGVGGAGGSSPQV